MTLRIRPPFEFENLLPYKVHFYLKDKTTNFEERDIIESGCTKRLHTVSPANFLTVAVDVPDASTFFISTRVLNLSELRATQLAVLSNTELDYRDQYIQMKDQNDRIVNMAFKFRYSECLCRYSN